MLASLDSIEQFFFDGVKGWPLGYHKWTILFRWTVEVAFGYSLGVLLCVVDTLRTAGLCSEEGCRTLEDEV